MVICQMALAVPAPQPLDASEVDSNVAATVPKDLDTANTFILGVGGLYGGYGGYGGYGYGGYPSYYGGYGGYGYPYYSRYL